MHIRHFQIYVSIQSFEMLHDIYWVFKFLSSKSIFYSFPHLLHQSIHAAKFVNVLLKLFAALHSHLPPTHIASVQVLLTLKFMIRHASNKWMVASSSARKSMCFHCGPGATSRDITRDLVGKANLQGSPHTY